MTNKPDLVETVVMIGLGLLFIVIGMRMLMTPGSLTQKSIMYRYMVQRLGYLSRDVARTGRLSLKQIRIYGAVLVGLGLLCCAVVLI